MDKIITLQEVAANEGLNPNYVQQLSLMKGFPEPIRWIGQTKIYDRNQVTKFFKERRKRHKRAA